LKDYQDPQILSAIYDEALIDMTLLAERHDRSDWVTVLNAAREKRREQEAAVPKAR
jgi:hypothetical protein